MHPHPQDRNVTRIEGWSNPRSSRAGRRNRRQSGADRSAGSDGGGLRPGSDEWWNEALRAFRDYIEAPAPEKDPWEREKRTDQESAQFLERPLSTDAIVAKHSPPERKDRWQGS